MQVVDVAAAAHVVEQGKALKVFIAVGDGGAGQRHGDGVPVAVEIAAERVVVVLGGSQRDGVLRRADVSDELVVFVGVIGGSEAIIEPSGKGVPVGEVADDVRVQTRAVSSERSSCGPGL